MPDVLLSIAQTLLILGVGGAIGGAVVSRRHQEKNRRGNTAPEPCVFDHTSRYVDDVVFEGGECAGRVERRVLTSGEMVRTMLVCEGHADTAVNFVRALAAMTGQAR